MTESVKFGSVKVSDAFELAAAIRKQLAGDIIPGETGDEGPEEAIWRFFHSVVGTPFEQVFIDALFQLLTDDDPVIRTSAVALAQDFAEKIDPRRLLALLDENTRFYEGVRPAGSARQDFGGEDLAWGLLRAIAGHQTSDERVLTRLRTAAKDPRHGARVLAGLTVSDPNWVLGNLIELIDLEPRRASIVLNNLSNRSARETFAKEASKSSRRARSAAVDAVKAKIKDPSERDRLLTLLSAA